MTMNRLCACAALALTALFFTPHLQAEDAHDHGEAHDLGSITVGATTLGVVLHGEVRPGGDAAVTTTVSKGPNPAVVRIWIGGADGRGTVKAKLQGEAGSYHGHCMAPDPMPEGAALWVQADDAEGGSAKASVALPAADHAHPPKLDKEHDHAHDEKKEAGHTHEGEAEHKH